MKKIISLILCVIFVCAAVAGCTVQDDQRKQSSYNGKTVNDILSGVTSEAGDTGANTPETSEKVTHRI